MALTDIVLTDLTTGSLDSSNQWVGTGVFDVLIHAVNKNIEGQYNQGRITSTDYANVYLGGLQSVIAQSMQFLLAEKQNEAQTDLLITQKLEAELDGASKRSELAAQTQLLIDQDSELLLNGTKDRLLKDAQISLANKDIALKTKELDVMTQDIALKTEQVALAAKQVDVAERDMAVKEELATQDLLNKASQKALLDTQKSELTLNGVKKRVIDDKQVLLVTRQTQGFNDNILTKMYEAEVGAWGLMLSSGMLDPTVDVPTSASAPGAMTASRLNTLATDLGNAAGVTL